MMRCPACGDRIEPVVELTMCGSSDRHGELVYWRCPSCRAIFSRLTEARVVERTETEERASQRERTIVDERATYPEGTNQAERAEKPEPTIGRERAQGSGEHQVT